MSKTIISKGGCLCGKVTFTARTMNPHARSCHCSICQRWTGGPNLSVDCGSDVSFQGQENIRTYRSSDWAERGFCKHCGSSLFYHLKQYNSYIIPTGIFDNNSQFIFDQQIFIDEKPIYYDFANLTRNMTGAEVFALHGTDNDQSC